VRAAHRNIACPAWASAP